MAKTRQQAIKELQLDHINKIAAFFDGWKQEVDDKIKIRIYISLNTFEEKLHIAAEVTCDGSPRYIFTSPDKNRNVQKAECFIAENEKFLQEQLCGYFKNEAKVKERFFVNTDPRGYALKIQMSPQECANTKIHHDWGHFGIICPEIKIFIKENNKSECFARFE